MKKLSQRQEDFCRLYLGCFSAGDAARLAGFPAKGSEKAGLRLLSRPEIQNRLTLLRRKEVTGDLRANALRLLFHLSSGGCGDALRLLTMEDTELRNEADALDLCAVAEIKRAKGGTEIKFIDRVKALETVCRLCDEAEGGSGAADLIRAVENSARSESRDA